MQAEEDGEGCVTCTRFSLLCEPQFRNLAELSPEDSDSETGCVEVARLRMRVERLLSSPSMEMQLRSAVSHRFEVRAQFEAQVTPADLIAS